MTMSHAIGGYVYYTENIGGSRGSSTCRVEEYSLIKKIINTPH